MIDFDLLDKIVEVQGTKNKIFLLEQAINNKDTKEFIDTIFNKDIYDIAEISIDKAINSPTKLFIDKKTFKEQVEFMKNLKGNDKIDSLSDFFSQCSKQEKYWYKNALLKKFPTVGIKTYNKALKNKGFEQLEVFELQLCESILLDKDKKVLSWNNLDPNKTNYVQHKYDGVRAYIIKSGNNISFFSRNGKELTTLGLLKQHFLDLYYDDDFIFDGEIIDRNGDFNVLSTKFRKLKNMAITDFKYKVFDVIEFNKESFVKKPQKERYNFLLSYFKNDKLIEVAETFITKNEQSILDHFNDVVSKGGEGIIIKPEDGLYEYGSRKYWWKMKPVYEGTFEIYNVEYGSGKYQGKISALWIRDKTGFINCKVGSGLTELDVDDLTKIGKNNLIGKFVDIFYSEISKKGLRFPRFKEPSTIDYDRNIRFRDDKTEADDLVSLKAKFDEIKEKQKVKETEINIENKNINW